MTHPAAAPAPSGHGELGCADVEGILAETLAENDALRERTTNLSDQNEALADQVAMYERADAARQAQLDDALADLARVRALVGAMSKKMRSAVDSRESVAGQVQILLEELEAAEADAVPVGTLLYATLSTEEMAATYRTVSRVTRGPLPPALAEAVKDAEESIVAAMHTAGQEALTKVVRKVVRRRRAAGKARPAARRSAPRKTTKATTSKPATATRAG